MRLQILVVALQFCFVVSLWSLWVGDWQLLFVNFVVVVLGIRWLRGFPPGRAPPLVPATLRRLLTGLYAASPALCRSSAAAQAATPVTARVAVRNAALGSTSLAGRALERNRVELATSQARASGQQERTGKPTESRGASGHGAAVPSTKLTAAFLAAQLAESRAEAEARRLAMPQSAAPTKSASASGPRRREVHSVLGAGLGVQDAASMAEAEVAAKKAEKQLLRLLAAEAKAKPSKSSSRQREAAATPAVAAPAVQSASPASPSVALARKAGGGATQKAPAKLAGPQPAVIAAAAAVTVSVAAVASAGSKRESEAALKTPANKKQVTPFQTTTVTKKEKERQRQAAKAGLVAVPAEKPVLDERQDEKLSAMLDAVAKSNTLNGRAISISSATTTSGSSSPSAASPASIETGVETDAEPQRSSTSGSGRQSDASGSGGVSESVEAGDGWSMPSSDASDARLGAESVGGESGDWAARIGEPGDGRGSAIACTLDDYFSYAYGLPSAEEAVQACEVPHNLRVAPPPPPPLVHDMTGQLSEGGAGLAQELRSIFPGAKIHFATGESDAPHVAKAAPVHLGNFACADSLSPAPPLSYAEPPRRLGPDASVNLYAGLPHCPATAKQFPRIGLPPMVGMRSCPPAAGAPPMPLGAPSVSEVEVLFNLSARSLGPPPAGALSVSEIEAQAPVYAPPGPLISQVTSSQAPSWRDRLRKNGEQQFGEVEAAMHSKHRCDIPANVPLGIHLPPIGSQHWPGGVEADNSLMAWQAYEVQVQRKAAELLLEMQVQAQLQTPNNALWAQAYPSEQTPYMDSMAMDSLYESELNAQMLAAGMPMGNPYDADQHLQAQVHPAAMPVECGINRQQIAAQLMAAAQCVYED